MELLVGVLRKELVLLEQVLDHAVEHVHLALDAAVVKFPKKEKKSYLNFQSKTRNYIHKPILNKKPKTVSEFPEDSMKATIKIIIPQTQELDP